jgi:hypothetical protein
MNARFAFSLVVVAAALLSACGGNGEPGDAVGAKVLRNLLERAKVPARLVSFKKTNGRPAHVGSADVYEYWYEAEVQFPEGYDAKCSEEKERGPCNALGLASDQNFQKNEILRSEGTLHFSGTAKGGWTGEDGQSY